MRSVFDFQACLDTVPISEIEIDPKSRNIINRFLDVPTRKELFRLLEQEYKSDTRKNRGRSAESSCPYTILVQYFQLIMKLSLLKP